MPYTGPRGRRGSSGFPYQQLFVLATCRIAEPISFMSIFPYIYYMIESFHITEDEKRIAFYAGLVISAFALAESMSSSIWGTLSDKFGRKPVLMCGLAGTGISMLIFGFSPNLQTALIARALGGLLNGNIGVIQTTVAEIVTNEEHYGRAFSIMPTVWCIGAIIGSVLGGTLADPVHNYPGTFQPGSIWERFPYLAPNLVCTMIVILCLVNGILFLEETHEDLKDRKDIGLELGRRIQPHFVKPSPKPLHGQKDDYPTETYVLLHDGEQPPDYRSAASSPGLEATAIGLPPPYHSIDSGNAILHHDANLLLEMDDEDVESLFYDESVKKRTSSVWHAFNTQLFLLIVSYGILAYHTISAEQLLPVLFSLPESDMPPKLPFWFTGGFALNTKTIGGILSGQGFIQIAVTFLIWPWIHGKLGSLKAFRMVALSYPLLYLLVPYLTLVPINFRIPAIYAILVWKVSAQAFAFPPINIMLANATPKHALGTFNGVAQSSASFARAIGPSISGLIEAAGLTRGMLGLPWWCNACIALIGAILSLCMIEQHRGSLDPEKGDLDKPAGTIPQTISPDMNAALVAAETTQDGVVSRPTSPLFVRLSMDMRRNARRDSKS